MQKPRHYFPCLRNTVKYLACFFKNTVDTLGLCIYNVIVCSFWGGTGTGYTCFLITHSCQLGVLGWRDMIYNNKKGITRIKS